MNTDRLKYRVWDKVEKRFIPRCIIDDEGSLFQMDQDTYRGECLFSSSPNWQVVQCTGLKDKNGKLIYEGDVLSGVYGPVIVEYDDECSRWWGNYQGFDHDELYNCSLDKCIIIGNIHENPELWEEGE